MYSYEDRLRAVELHINLGKRVWATIRQLGYPTKNALKGWFREYEQRRDLAKARARPEPKYSQGRKDAAVRHYLDHWRCIAATMKALGYLGSYLGEMSPAPDNLLNRDFRAAVPNEKWLTDITEFQIPAGKVYLSPMIDCFDGMVVSWSIGTRPDAELVNLMLDAAIETVAFTSERSVVHSDRGAHCHWPGWLRRMANGRLVRSMSRKGCSPDNAACEGFFCRLKTELFYPRNWQSAGIEQFVQAVDSYTRWYNEKRIKISLGSLSPLEYRQSLGISA